MGLESIFAPEDRRVLVADMRSAGLLDFGIDIKASRPGEHVVAGQRLHPRYSLFRLADLVCRVLDLPLAAVGAVYPAGALVSIGVVAQLYVGLANIPRPFEWEWSYGAIMLLSVAMLGAAAGRFWGLDGWLRPRVAGAAKGGNILARIALLLS